MDLLPPCAFSLGFRYTTVMAYRCDLSTQPDESSAFAPPVRFFSNPDVDYLGLPTGTPTENNARTLRDNMV